MPAGRGASGHRRSSPMNGQAEPSVEPTPQTTFKKARGNVTEKPAETSGKARLECTVPSGHPRWAGARCTAAFPSARLHVPCSPPTWQRTRGGHHTNVSAPSGRVLTRGSGVRPPDGDLPSAAPGTHQELQGLCGGACARHVGTSRCGKAKAVAPSDPACAPEAPGSGSHRHPRRPTSALHRAPRPPAPPSGLHGHRASLCSVFSRLLLRAPEPSGAAPSTHYYEVRPERARQQGPSTDLARPCNKETSHTARAWWSPSGHLAMAGRGPRPARALVHRRSERGELYLCPWQMRVLLRMGTSADWSRRALKAPWTPPPPNSRSLRRMWAYLQAAALCKQQNKMGAHNPSRTYNLT